MSREGTSTLERAFQLARAGACHSIDEIRQQLNLEGYENVHGHLHGASLQKQLKAALAARGVKAIGADDEDDA